MEDYRKILFPYAYNILGSSEDAKDAVQDVLANYIAAPREGIDNIKGYLVKSVINHAINVKNRRKKVRYYEDAWLPEPVATQGADTNINAKDIISYSMMILLEQLNPKERAVFILKEAFGYSHEDIADVLSGTVEHSRKLLSRAKLKLNESKQPLAHPAKVPHTFFQQYIDAIRDRDVAGLEKLLSQDIVLTTDGGEKMRITRKFAFGKKSIARLLIYVNQKFQKKLSVVFSQLNHQPAILFCMNDRPIVCHVLEMEDDKVKKVNIVVDQKKLKNLPKL